MTELVIFDTDCLSSFLCVNEIGILNQLYKGKMAIPDQVLVEFHRRHDLFVRVQKMVERGDLQQLSIRLDDQEYKLYREYTTSATEHHPAMGRGESAAIVLAQTRRGLLACDNFRDIKKFIDYLQLPYITTPDILVSACKKRIIQEGRGNVIWRDLLNAGRRIPQCTFSEYYANH